MCWIGTARQVAQQRVSAPLTPWQAALGVPGWSHFLGSVLAVLPAGAREAACNRAPCSRADRGVQAYDFLVAIAEPVSRPELLHEYRLTQHSLYAAVSVGLTAEGIITWLDRFSKVRHVHARALGRQSFSLVSICMPQVPVSSVIQQFIEHCTRSYGARRCDASRRAPLSHCAAGRVKVVLKRNTYYMESPDEEVLRKLLDSPVVAAARRATEVRRSRPASPPLACAHCARLRVRGWLARSR